MKKIVLTLLCLLLSAAITLCCSPAVLASAPEYTIKLRKLGDNVRTHTDLQKQMIHGDLEALGWYRGSSNSLAYPDPILLVWSSPVKASSYEIRISEHADMHDAIVYTSPTAKKSIYNLKIGKKYYWTVSDGTVTSDVGSFTTEYDTVRNLNVSGFGNVRDVGGYFTEDGKHIIKQDLLFRTNQCDNAYEKPDAMAEMIDHFGIKTEIDLRKPSQNGNQTTSSLGGGVTYYNIPMDYNGAANYKETVQVFKLLADERNYPMFFHCQAGKDRTGMVSFVLHALLGCSEHDCMLDYLFTNLSAVGGVNYDGVYDYYEQIKMCKGDTLKEKTQNHLKSMTGPNGEKLTDADFAAIERIFLDDPDSLDENILPLYGDANDDGKINAKDVLLLRKHTAKIDVDYHFANANVNLDDTVSSKDILLIRKHIAKIKVAPWDDEK